VTTNDCDICLIVQSLLSGLTFCSTYAKNYESCLALDEVIATISRLTFLAHPVCINKQPFTKENFIMTYICLSIGTHRQTKVKRAKLPDVREPAGPLRPDGKRPHGVTLISWAKGKSMSWDVTVPDTFAESHLSFTATQQAWQPSRQQTTRPRSFRNLRKPLFSSW